MSRLRSMSSREPLKPVTYAKRERELEGGRKRAVEGRIDPVTASRDGHGNERKGGRAGEET